MEVLETSKKDMNALVVCEEVELAIRILCRLGACYRVHKQDALAKENYLLAFEMIH